jgi:hypothetical protein
MAALVAQGCSEIRWLATKVCIVVYLVYCIIIRSVKTTGKNDHIMFPQKK